MSNIRWFDKLNYIYRAAPDYWIFSTILLHCDDYNNSNNCDKKTAAAVISRDVAGNSRFMHFFLLAFVFYIKVGHEDYSTYQSLVSKPFMFLFGPQLHFTLFIFNIRFIFREIPLGFLNSGFLSLLNSLMKAVALLILRLIMLSGLTGHPCFSNNTIIHTSPSLLMWKKTFPFLESFLNSLSFHTRNLIPAIPFLSLFSALYLHLFPRTL